MNKNKTTGAKCDCENYQGASCAKCQPKPTPGPWKHTEDGYIRRDNPQARDISYSVIASINHGTDDEGQANARLIAAAPEQNASLTEMVLCFGTGPESEEWWSDHAESVTACDCGEPSTPEHPHTAEDLRAQVLNRARAALAKAQG